MRMTTQYNITNGKLIKALADLSEITVQCDQLQMDLTKKMNMEKIKDVEIVRLSKENAALMKERDVAKKYGQNVDVKNTELMMNNTKMRFVSVVVPISKNLLNCDR